MDPLVHRPQLGEPGACDTNGILPPVTRWVRVRGPDERQQPSQFWNGVHFAHHGTAQDMVVGPDPVH